MLSISLLDSFRGTLPNPILVFIWQQASIAAGARGLSVRIAEYPPGINPESRQPGQWYAGSGFDGGFCGWTLMLFSGANLVVAPGSVVAVFGTRAVHWFHGQVEQ